jgi:hypothetical protein
VVTVTRRISWSSWRENAAILTDCAGLADSGSSDAVGVLVELASEREDLQELRRLAAAGSGDEQSSRPVDEDL